ncbi:MAG: NAD(P)-dependent glycerol-3-phosphate dehydrogenase [Lachnospiraceae bacterium]|nr:NAD(P)-dependent glycerol-3-phosphate dehydrogenase [Lachnospiraceae bacterium]
MAKVTVLGAGSWALGLSILLSDNGHDVIVWSAVADEINILKETGENPKYLPGVKIPETIKLTCDLEEAVKDRDILVMAVASKFTRSTAARLKGLIKDGQIIVNVAKGLETGTYMILTDVIKSELPDAEVYALSGPSHAEEVSRRLPTVVTVAGENPETAKYLQDVFSSEVFRVYTSNDVLGIELGGALKNVIALAAGIADGLGYGDNIKAALITRGIKEMARLAIKMGARTETLYGLTGMGDLIVTCASMHSRNRRAGILIGQGKSMDEAIKEVNMVVEGIVSAQSAKELALKYDVEMPIVFEVNKVLFEGASPRESVNNLMLRGKIDE